MVRTRSLPEKQKQSLFTPRRAAIFIAEGVFNADFDIIRSAENISEILYVLNEYDYDRRIQLCDRVCDLS